MTKTNRQRPAPLERPAPLGTKLFPGIHPRNYPAPLDVAPAPAPTNLGMPAMQPSPPSLAPSPGRLSPLPLARPANPNGGFAGMSGRNNKISGNANGNFAMSM